ncbi:DUF6236 family protein [Klebsiella pneumoniae]|jgi:hypothetical protein|uniref:DUF6236 family protein n=2 Tax=Klebsiella/Raoultella group TaxID=2890311 RepID=UPI0011250E4A|nr:MULTISPECIES: DUF6236 family protein [Klebsiella]HCM2946967.1 hypothetical protein [Klebsiella quasipneumoniae subsp. similipneumoniae]HDS7512396.1 hypothetical protein [Klebsiella pneumoniae subsp. pneumoniae]MBC5592982.1 hypothetical protein [Klebsiella pneumoniae]MBK2542598.1 hypothetical protein [Klebsiella quasipneumoniae]MBK2627437.1 hypothetical protein [Klebsiella quasipneumoniae]
MENHVLMFPDMFINADNNSIHIAESNLNYRKLLINALYWDKIITTNNNLINISNDETPGIPELKREGLFTEVMLRINGSGDFATLLYDANMKFMIDSLARKDINFIASEADKVLIKNSNEVAPDNGELFTLINAIPEPDESVNIHDILEFRLKRKGELENLMNKINELNTRVLNSQNRDLELKVAINEIDKACADVIRLYGESRIKFNLSEVKFNFNIPEIVTNAGAAYFGAKSIGLPETGAILASATYGFSTFVNFSSAMSLRRIDKSNPFNYVGQMSVKLN